MDAFKKANDVVVQAFAPTSYNLRTAGAGDPILPRR